MSGSGTAEGPRRGPQPPTGNTLPVTPPSSRERSGGTAHQGFWSQLPSPTDLTILLHHVPGEHDPNSSQN